MYVLGMFFPGLTSYQKPAYPQNQMLQQASNKSPLLKDQCYHLPFGQYFSSKLSVFQHIWTSPSAARIQRSCLVSFPMQMICWFTTEINMNMMTSKRWFQENFKPLASRWMTNVNSKKSSRWMLLGPCWARRDFSQTQTNWKSSLFFL